MNNNNDNNVENLVNNLIDKKTNEFIDKLFPDNKLTITKDEFLKFFEENYFHLLSHVIEKEKTVQSLKEDVKEWRAEHSNSLALQFDNERQKLELKKLNHELSASKKIFETDMQIAQMVQKSFLISSPPEINDFDIAFCYYPYASVSGDFYDFYVDKKGHLLGLTLADVSGHGIASGLLTTLGKSIFSNVFMNYLSTPLGKVMEQINDRLITEINNIDEYITGILFRFNDDILEVVSAAHPDAIIKSSRSNCAKKLKPDDIDIQGHFLGESMFPNSYKSYKFNIKNQDIILIYSDCLVENRNKDEKPYTEDKLMASLDQVTFHMTSQEIIDKVIGDFMTFKGDAPLSDDLTVIVLKKK